MKLLFNLTLLVLWVPLDASARPVSYAGGATAMQMNDQDRHSIHLHYSPTVNYSLGYKGEYWHNQNWQFHGIQLNNLLKRWNKPSSQTNFYLKSALGTAITDDDKSHFAAFTGIAFDWEDRRFFTSYENRLYDAGNINQFFTQSARVGVAPYIGDYGDLHTWLMLQVDHRPEQNDPVTITPLIRLFKNEYLAEAGISEHGDLLVNLVIRY